MRLVSLCPSLTETVVALGLRGALVGRTKFCVYPADAVADVPRVGGTKDPKVDRIVALAPDWVLMNEEENRKEDADALRAAGLRVHASFPRAPDDVPGLIEDLGDLLGVETDAYPVAARVRDELAAVREQVSGARQRFAFLIWRGPYMAAGADTYVGRLLELAGGQNVVAGAERYPTIEPGQLRDAERVLLSSEPYPFAAQHADELAAASGLPRERFVLCDGQLLTWHGPRTGQAAQAARALLA
jgi:iron complex transport system substrate-binding protein